MRILVCLTKGSGSIPEWTAKNIKWGYLTNRLGGRPFKAEISVQFRLSLQKQRGSLKLWNVISLESSSEAERNTVNVEVEISKFSSPAKRLTNSVNF